MPVPINNLICSLSDQPLSTIYLNLFTLPIKLILFSLSLIDTATKPIVCSIMLSLKIIMNFFSQAVQSLSQSSRSRNFVVSFQLVVAGMLQPGLIWDAASNEHDVSVSRYCSWIRKVWIGTFQGVYRASTRRWIQWKYYCKIHIIHNNQHSKLYHMKNQVSWRTVR